MHEADALHIDSWLMSCRIFSRSAEQLILRALIGIAAGMGAASVYRRIPPTARTELSRTLSPARVWAAGAGLLRRDLARG